VSCVEGATILGSGEVVPILKVPDLLETDSAGAAPAAATQEENKPARLLVVDDSITSRMLIKNILEAAGYQVEIAVDGRVALELLQNEGEEFDLVVSDVEMPFVDGFALTEALREDETLAEMPVVLVTSLGSREDRERGVAAGADAYIVKSEFDQQNLLEVVESLVQE
jgi:two-component system chemotaxis sensor kinase CheA